MRVVLLTAHGTPEVITKAKESGVHTVVVKPFTPAELMAGVARAAGATAKS
jgi:AmiR/NasT family two-component response regulator